jgi:hypothetical protein
MYVAIQVSTGRVQTGAGRLISKAKRSDHVFRCCNGLKEACGRAGRCQTILGTDNQDAREYKDQPNASGWLLDRSLVG